MNCSSDVKHSRKHQSVLKEILVSEKFRNLELVAFVSGFCSLVGLRAIRKLKENYFKVKYPCRIEFR